MTDPADVVPLPVAPASRPAPAADTLIVTPDAVTGHGIVRLLELAGVTGSTRIAHDVDAALDGPAVTLALVSANLPYRNAVVAALRLHRAAERIVLVAGRSSTGPLPPLGDTGIQGMLTGNETPAALARIVELILAGVFYWPAEMPRPGAGGGRTISTPAGSRSPLLTPRQWEVAERIVQGNPNKVIAYDLGLSEGTVKIHITAILKALNVPNRTTAAAYLVPLLEARSRAA